METKRLTIPEAEEILGLYFPCLDHGYVSLRDYMGGDSGVEEAARTSYSYGIRQRGEQRSLLRSLVRRRHTSPSEQIELKFHMAMPIFVARQIVRHRTASINELSGRYSLMPMLFYTPSEDKIQRQSKKDKQGRGDATIPGVETFLDNLQYNREHIVSDYHWATENDLARELARIDLPLSTYTCWYWKIDAHNLMHALGLRCDLHAQEETREYFNTLAGMLKRVAPISFEAWEDYEFYARKMSRMEMDILRDMIDHGVDDHGKGWVQGVRPYSGCQTDFGVMQKRYGLSKTECQEFIAKFDQPTVVNFDLDLSKAKPGSYFQEMYEKAAEVK
jgi:thymidylate synthase (FAD)